MRSVFFLCTPVLACLLPSSSRLPLGVGLLGCASSCRASFRRRACRLRLASSVAPPPVAPPPVVAPRPIVAPVLAPPPVAPVLAPPP
ncbi:uncharacterized protein HKW66_Vig0230940 [Vigna angularis]|uniref:Secreted protein n=1 Tax=Phaseolus angularis TaxID=3914 RepID=A0A8T0KC24_PHAAN|nr:uncharacterized protein HKW66_Vig0230940 [Vigna angularis]